MSLGFKYGTVTLMGVLTCDTEMPKNYLSPRLRGAEQRDKRRRRRRRDERENKRKVCDTDGEISEQERRVCRI